MERVETERLIGTRPLLRDADELGALFAEIGASARSVMVRDADRWKRDGFGPWILRDRATNAIVGRAGLARDTAGGRDGVEVGWAIVPQRRGEGLATEIAREAIRVAFEELSLPDLVAFTLPGNAASLRVMEKCGFAYEAGIVHAGQPHVLHRLHRIAP